jgi:solute carrier family 41
MVIPAILNLKGNLEMNLSARLGTAANVGELGDPTTRRSIITGNLTLLQVQATTVSFIVACLSSIIALLFPGLFPEVSPPSPGTSTPEANVTSALLLVARRPRIPFPDTGEQINPGFSTYVPV